MILMQQGASLGLESNVIFIFGLVSFLLYPPIDLFSAQFVQAIEFRLCCLERFFALITPSPGGVYLRVQLFKLIFRQWPGGVSHLVK